MYVSARKTSYRSVVKTDEKTPSYVTYRELNESTDKIHTTIEQKIEKVSERFGQEIVRIWSTIADIQAENSEIKKDVRGMYRDIIRILILILLTLIGIMFHVPELIGVTV